MSQIYKMGSDWRREYMRCIIINRARYKQIDTYRYLYITDLRELIISC